MKTIENVEIPEKSLHGKIIMPTLKPGFHIDVSDGDDGHA